ncbi:undecaprenyl/decaprenyl-phosphate alpha-N-acetylglucosaminyl 1-phosphate transferase [Patescibacteria group bacterium]|nr:undecaprenyl/decaprenyl-phosphate alpha-N-acetylglucosaminyl 1-phosphate transferase [Patescibacteria group bacterium]
MIIFSHLGKYLELFPLFIISFITTLIITPLIGIISKRFKIYDNPPTLRNDPTAKRRIHNVKKLRLGGIAIIIPFVILTLLNLPLTKNLIIFIICILILLTVGIIDDIFDIPAKYQLLFQIIVGLITVLSGIDINYISKPLGGIFFFNQFPVNIFGNTVYLLSAFITFIWILFIINAIKWMAGTDGLAEGNVSIAAIIIALLSIRFFTHDTAVMGFIFSGLMLGFLFYNFYPSKIFSGSSGKSVYGYIIAILAIYSGAKLASTIIVLSIPIIDAIYVIYKRIREEKPKSISALIKINDKRHLHYKLLGLGYNQRQVALIEYIFTIIIGIVALIVTGFHKAIILAVILLIIMLFIFTVNKKSKVKNI